MAGLGDLVAVLSANAAPWTKGFAAAGSTLNRFASSAQAKLSAVSGFVGQSMSAGMAVPRMLGGIGSFIAKLGLITVAITGIKTAINTLTMPLSLAANAEKTQIAFTTMLQSADKAKTLIGELNAFAASTPFEQPEIVDAGRKLLAFGIEAKNIIPTLTSLGDVAAGIDQPIGELAELFGKAKVAGRLMSEDINQLTGRGIPIITELAKVFKKPESAIKKMVEEGKVNFGHLQQAFANMTGKGGQFSGLMAAQSQSTGGLWSTLKDNLGITFTEIGTALIEGFNLKGLMTNSIAFLEQFRSQWLPGITATISATGAAWGAYISELWASWSGWITDSQASLFAWADSFMGAFNQALQFGSDLVTVFKEVFIGASLLFGVSWSDTFNGATASLSYMMRNWYTLLQICVQNVILFASNSWKHIEAFFTNFAAWIAWVPGNWQKIMYTMADLLSTVFINMAKNVRGFFKSLWDFAAGKGFDFKATGITEGFHNSIDKLPTMVSAAVDASTPELSRLYDKLNKDEAAFAAKQAERAKNVAATSPAAVPAVQPKTLADIITKTGVTADTKKATKKEHTDTKAIEAGSAEAFRLFAHAQQGPKSATDKIASNTANANKLLGSFLAGQERQTKAIEAKKSPTVAKLR